MTRPDIGAAGSGDFAEIPVVDISLWRGNQNDRDALATQVRTICHEIGFFVIINHGIPTEFIDSVFTMMDHLFELPPDQKQLIDKVDSRHFRGWEATGAEYTNNRPDIREQVDFWTEHPPRSSNVDPEYLRLLGPNQWLPDSILPGFEALVNEWFDRLGALGDELVEILSVSLGLDEGHIDRLFGDERMSLTKLINYPPTPSDQMGVNAHHDAGFLTILAPGSTPGLQVQNSLEEWIPVPIMAGSFVINLGEMLQGMTGNYFVATPHRVVTDSPRKSAGYFHGPSLTASLDPLPLAPEFAEAVAASPRHSLAGFMARKEETAAGVGDMQSDHKPGVYGEQLWNYFARSYPDNMDRHYGNV